MQKSNSIVLYGYYGESLVDRAVGGFRKSFFQQFVVAVVVTEYSDKRAIQFCQLRDNKSCNIVACMKNQTYFMFIKALHGFFDLG